MLNKVNVELLSSLLSCLPNLCWMLTPTQCYDRSQLVLASTTSDTKHWRTVGSLVGCRLKETSLIHVQTSERSEAQTGKTR